MMWLKCERIFVLRFPAGFRKGSASARLFKSLEITDFRMAEMET